MHKFCVGEVYEYELDTAYTIRIDAIDGKYGIGEYTGPEASLGWQATLGPGDIAPRKWRLRSVAPMPSGPDYTLCRQYAAEHGYRWVEP